MTSSTRVTDAYRESIESAHAARVARLRSAVGWLSLVGKAFLAQGTSTRIGSAAECEARLPEGAPAHVGTIDLQGKVARFVAADGVDVKCEGAIVKERVLKSDHDGKADALDVGGFILELMERGDVFALRIRDHRELPRPYEGIDNYAIDPTWNVHARFEPHASPKSIELDFEGATGSVSDSFTSPGFVSFDREGKTHRLEVVYEDSSKKRFFILFRDATSGHETYGSGRFVYAPLPSSESNELLIDFNLALLPGCAFTTFATCPIPPRDNRLAIAVRAGEKNYIGKAIGE